ncbi:hypothetical protein J6590_075972 [Homalodisca vitripennis]|nr:hypothetical protein J6590_075972 [Homalodisca vitripennis]
MNPRCIVPQGQVGNVITNRNANRLEFERLLDGAKTYMRHHKVPGGMKRRVLRWYDYSWSRSVHDIPGTMSPTFSKFYGIKQI